MDTMFVWRSEALKNYQSGHLIALAADADKARAKIRNQIEPWIREHREWLLPEYNGGDSEDYDEFVAKFEADLAKEPTTHDHLFIMGSE